ncbi:MAG: hypothetical protein P1U58_20020 [Verrucomicrobiales bacterium]|nr:hypothetical protein [Verrucomicrobiales bacterium]
MMILALDIPFIALPVAVGVIALILGLIIGKLSGKKSALIPPEEPENEPEEEEDDPTAPIVPMIEMARSPHDRHRDLAVGKGIVRQIDFLDTMIKSAEKNGDSDATNQLALLRKEFEGLLKECAVEAFDYAPETVVAAEMRSRIQIIGGSTREGERTRIAETIRCGFTYLHGDEDTMIIRKAEVLIK